MSRIRVGVIRGGPSSEYDVSLKTGAMVLRHLPEEKYEVHDLLITKDGEWHWRGIPVSPDKISRHFDVVFNALHGEYGEDGQIQQLLESINMPYTGSTAYASSVGMNKVLAKEYFRQLGLKTPFGETATRDEGESESIAHRIFKKISPPWIVKPTALGSSIGATVAKNFAELIGAIENAFSHSSKIMVEECVKCREATCGVIENFRWKEHYTLIPVQKISSGTESHACPGHFTEEESDAIQQAAVTVHKGLGFRHYSNTDIIVSPRGLYVLEANSLPGITPESLLPKSLEAVGCEYSHFLDHIVTLAIDR